jgi:Glycosyl transferase family 2
MILSLVITSVLFALVPALLFRANKRAYAPPPCPPAGQEFPPVSVLIPARNEENAIGDAVRAALQNQGIDLEVVVLDDHSEDRTVAIVEQLIATDERVRLVRSPELPAGWCGKQHACWVLAREARHPLLLFIDADVRLVPDALARMTAFVSAAGADLASGIPHQEAVSLLEKLLIPLIHFILLGFLPIRWMRRSRQPSFAAGCGQLFIARAQAYRRCGGHSVIRDTLHDGLKLPRAFRVAGLKTDLFDATDLATCRMYRTAGEVWFGLAKNAGEALAAPAMIGPMTAVLLGGQVLPVILLLLGLCSWPEPWPKWQATLALAATVAAYYPRLAAVWRFRQSLLGAILHPLGILILLAIQWFAFLCNALGRPSTWKGRPYPTPGTQTKLLTPRELEPTR